MRFPPRSAKVRPAPSARQLALGAGGRLQRDAVHAGDLGRALLQPQQELERALQRCSGWYGCRSRSPGSRPRPRCPWGCTSSCTSQADKNAMSIDVVAVRETRDSAGRDPSSAQLGKLGRFRTHIACADDLIQVGVGDVSGRNRGRDPSGKDCARKSAGSRGAWSPSPCAHASTSASAVAR